MRILVLLLFGFLAYGEIVTFEPPAETPRKPPPPPPQVPQAPQAPRPDLMSALFNQGQCSGYQAGCLRIKSSTWRENRRPAVEKCVGGGKPCEPMLPQKNVNCIVIHHSGVPNRFSTAKDPVQGVQNLYRFSREDIDTKNGNHKVKIWGDVPYHFLVDRFGNLVEGRSPAYQPDSNTNFDRNGKVNVMVEGDYNPMITDPQNPNGPKVPGDKYKKEQGAIVAATVNALVTKYTTSTNPVYVIPHKWLASTDCPGDDVIAALQAAGIKLSRSCPALPP